MRISSSVTLSRPILSVTLVLAALGIAAAPTPVAADCGMVAPSSHMRGYLGGAFTGTVRDLQRGGVGEVDWTVTIDIDEVFRGDPPDPFVFSDYGGACGVMEAGHLVEGARLLMSVPQVEGINPARELGRYPLIWRRVEGGWRFWIAAMNEHRDAPYPAAARAATTRAAIVALVTGDELTLPPTDQEPPEREDVAALLVPILFALAALIGGLAWIGSQRRRTRNDA